MDPVDLRTARLVLDQPGEADVDLIAEYCADPVFERFMITPWPYERQHAAGFVHGLVPTWWADGAEATWAIRHPERGFVGVIGLGLAREDRPGGMLGFWLGAPHRGLGFMPEAASAVIAWGFDAGGLDLIRWEAVLGNRASLSVARRIGFRYTGERESQLPARDGGPQPGWHGELRADESREPKDGWPA